MEKINVSDFGVEEKMFVSKKCVVIFGSEKPARIYNLKGELLVKTSAIDCEKDLGKTIFFAENAFIYKAQNAKYYVKDYDGNVIEKFNASEALIDELKYLVKFEEKNFYKKFRERKIVSDTYESYYGLDELKTGATIWVSPNYLVAKTKKSEMKIYAKSYETIELLGTIPKSNFGCAKSFRKRLEDNCHWYGVYQNMAIKEKNGWKIVDEEGKTIIANISDLVMKIFTGSVLEKNDNETALEYNGFQVKAGEIVYKNAKIFIVKEQNREFFRFYSSNGIFLIGTSEYKKAWNRVIKTEHWIAIYTLENGGPDWRLFDYSGKFLYKDVHRVVKRNQMYLAEEFVDYMPEKEKLLIFSSSGELKASIIGFEFRYEDDCDYIRVYNDSNSFEIYDYNGKKILDTIFSIENDIIYGDTIIQKNEKGGYTEYNLTTKKSYNLDCQEIMQIESFENLTAVIRKNGLCGVFKHIAEENTYNLFNTFAEVIPIKYDKITSDNCWFYAKYQETDYLGKQSVYEDIYDEDGNFVMKVKV